MVIEIRRARSDRNAAKLLWLSLLHFLFRGNFFALIADYKEKEWKQLSTKISSK